ncbi:MAG: glycoside hydrolase family 130 protein [Cellulomonas sp.]|nr:glycoside hydrolase family 130 protein [Cellulomonas sp.]
MGPDPAWVTRTDHLLAPDRGRVVTAIFLPGQELAASGRSRSASVLGRVLALSDVQVEAELAQVVEHFGTRHRRLEAIWESHFRLIAHRVDASRQLSVNRRRLIGAYFTQEFAVEGAGLFNPSMVAHPDQSGLPTGSVRFLMTLRGVGEGHVSCIEMRTGVVDADDQVVLDPPPTVAVLPEEKTATYSLEAFAHQLRELGDDRADADFVLARLASTFGPGDLASVIARLKAQGLTRVFADRTVEDLERIAASTYVVEFPIDSSPAERVLTPQSPHESNGVEDARMVRTVADDGQAEYLGTYTAYDGRAIGQQLLRTRDFRTFTSTPITGQGSRNKGLALFPRRIGGRYAAISRAVRESNAITTSSDMLHWDDPVLVQVPERPWEIVQLGNCGPPIETEAGWLVLTHGVGPMRTYAIGAMLLDLDDPRIVLASLEQPFLTPNQDERAGYVPNVVYSCGAMLHGRTLVLPYGCSDAQTRIALVDLDGLLGAMVPRTRTRTDAVGPPAVAVADHPVGRPSPVPVAPDEAAR